MENNKNSNTGLKVFIFILILLVLLLAFGIFYYQNELKNANAALKQAQNSQTSTTTQNTVTETTTASDEKDLLTLSEIAKLFENEKRGFHVESVEKVDENTSIITAYLLTKEPRYLTDEEYENLQNGGTIKYRNKELSLKISDNSFSPLVDKDGNQYPPLFKDNEKWSVNVASAGPAGPSKDFEKEIKFKVSNDILIGTYWVSFKFDNDGNLVPYKVDTEEEITDTNSNNFVSLEKLVELSKNTAISGDCSAFVKDGEVKAIRISANK